MWQDLGPEHNKYVTNQKNPLASAAQFPFLNSLHVSATDNNKLQLEKGPESERK
eukprot:m.27631 g.27631  ORF g.27631 m.27631 type:complete len:54 (+) comp10289_c0_seq1:362-523(+)